MSRLRAFARSRFSTLQCLDGLPVSLNSRAVPLPSPATALPFLQAVPRPAGVALLMLVSGFAGLVYQIVWTQQLGVWLGHEIVSVLAVVAAFFGGLALGAWRCGAWVARSARPGRGYALLELTIALWALLLIPLMPLLGSALTVAIGAEPGALRHWLVAFLGPLLILLPATAAMGATLPALAQVFGRLPNQGYAIGGLYAANTLGAVFGVIASAFLLAPKLGYNTTAVIAAALNLFCAAYAWRAFAGLESSAEAPAVARSSAPLLRLAATGLLGIGYEVLIVRVISQIAENTVYTYAASLAIYLLGTALGAALYQAGQRWFGAHRDAASLRARLLALTAFGVLLGGLAMTQAATVKQIAAGALGGGFEAALTAEAAVAAFAFLIPTMAMGALFSHLGVEARDAGWRLGDALAANTLGATFAAPLIAVALLPLLGAGPLIGLLALAYLLLLPIREARRVGVLAAAAAGLAWLLIAPSLRFVTVPDGGRILSYRDGVMAAVSVIEDAGGERRLHINDRAREGSSQTRFTDAREAWAPLLLHDDPKRALFLGLGTGITSSAAAADKNLSVDAVELLPEVIAASRLFVPKDAPQPHIVAADARRYVRASETLYDVIVADLFHPARSGSGALYTVEHFDAVRARLAPGGLFCQWLPLHQLDLASLQAIVAAYLAVYPDAVVMLATYSLDTPVLGLVSGAPFDRAQLAARLSAEQRGGALAGLQYDDAFVLPGSIVADAESLRAFSAGVTANRDDHPVVSYRAPQLTYAPDSRPRDRLMSVIGQWTASPTAIFGAPKDAIDTEWQSRIAAYWQARNAFLQAGMNVQPVADPQAMLAQVHEPLLAVLRLSPDFRPAYEPLLRIAMALADRAPDEARAVLAELVAIQPDRPEAAAALRQLEPSP